MNQLVNVEKNELRAELMRRGLSLRKFAEKHGFAYGGVYMAFSRHCGNYDSNPYGVVTKEIVRRLYEEINSPVDDEATQSVN